jgi:hypothetical protein
MNGHRFADQLSRSRRRIQRTTVSVQNNAETRFAIQLAVYHPGITAYAAIEGVYPPLAAVAGGWL